MRLLIVGDSHCRDMETLIDDIMDHYAQVLSVIVGGQTLPIKMKYRDLLQKIIKFDPSHVLLHLGHNELARHPTKNTVPSISRDIATETLSFAREISTNFPSATICISAIFPRTFTRRSYLSNKEVTKFNKDVDRHALRIRKQATEEGFLCAMNNPIWRRISKSEEDPNFFMIDGFHLDPSAKRIIAKNWLISLGVLNPDPIAPANINIV